MNATRAGRRLAFLLTFALGASVLPVGLSTPGAAAGAPVKADCGDGEGLATGAVAGQAQGAAAGILGGPSGEIVNSQFGAFENVNETFGRCADEAGLGGQGGSQGDPHLITQDRLTYDFHGRGDFVLLRSATNDMEIQARFRRADSASFLDAVAFRTGGTTVTIEDLNHHATPILTVDGVTTPAAAIGWFDLDSGLMFRIGKRVWAALDSGVLIEASRSGLSLFTPEDWAGSFVGLLGNGDGDVSNDIATSDGVLVNPSDYDSLYGPFFESWFVQPGDSLMTIPFDEASDGPIRPEVVIALGDLDPGDVAAAEQVCADAGLVAGSGFEGCVFDVALTGDPIWAEDIPRAALAPSVSALDGASASQISPDIVDAGLGEETSTAIDVADDGTIHISYHDDMTNYLMHASKAPQSEGWATEVVDGDGSISENTNVGDPNAIVVNDDIYILYYERSPNDLDLALLRDGSWTIEAVDDSGATSGTYLDLAGSSDGVLYASYYDRSNGDLRFGFRDRIGSWDLQAVDTTGDVGRDAKIAIGPGTRPDVHIAYRDVTNDSLKYARGSFDEASGRYSFDAADVMTVDATVGAGLGTDLAVDAEGRVHITYMGDSITGVRHAWLEAGIWTIDTAAVSVHVGSRTTAVVAGTDGRVHVAFRSANPTGLVLATGTYDGAAYTWTTRVVDGRANVGAYASLAIGPDGSLHFAYQDAAAGAIRYATLNP